jgi:hypothetical protein
MFYLLLVVVLLHLIYSYYKQLTMIATFRNVLSELNKNKLNTMKIYAVMNLYNIN